MSRPPFSSPAPAIVLLSVLFPAAALAAPFGPYFIPRSRAAVDVAYLVGSAAPADLVLALGDGPERRYPGSDAAGARTVADMGQLRLVKWLNIPIHKLGAVHYRVLAGDKTLAEGRFESAPGSDSPFSFLVYGDLREEQAGASETLPQHSYLQADSVMLPTVAYLDEYLHHALALTPPQTAPVLSLLTGDLVNLGQSLPQWNEFLDAADPVLKDRLIISAMGNHEGFGQSRTDPRGVPYFGNLFYFDTPEPAPQPAVYTQTRALRVFDIGCVRYIALPVTHESDPDLHNLKALLDTFIENLVAARKAKEVDHSIRFIVVYGHVPLVSSPVYGHPGLHPGLFQHAEANREDDKEDFVLTEKLAQAIVENKVDLYLNGHNHLYDRVSWNGIPMVTVGLATPPDGARFEVMGHAITGEKFIDKYKDTLRVESASEVATVTVGFLECLVEPGKTGKREAQIRCTLRGKRMPESQHPKHFTQPDYQVLDTFTVHER